MQTVYLRPDRCPLDWGAPTPVGVGGLSTELIAHLGDAQLDPARRARAEGVLIDLIEPLHVATIELRMPRDPRALDVAAALVRNRRPSARQWGREVGAGEAALARAFQAETGVSFGRWRTQLRLQRCRPSRRAVSDRAGSESPSAFVAAFRRETGMTPTSSCLLTNTLGCGRQAPGVACDQGPRTARRVLVEGGTRRWAWRRTKPQESWSPSFRGRS